MFPFYLNFLKKPVFVKYFLVKMLNNIARRIATFKWQWAGTLLSELTAGGDKKVHDPEEALLVGLQQDGASNWLRTREPDGCNAHDAGLVWSARGGERLAVFGW